jgi:hypothetical protein
VKVQWSLSETAREYAIPSGASSVSGLRFAPIRSGARMYDCVRLVCDLLRELKPKKAEDGTVIAEEHTDDVNHFITELLSDFIRATLSDKFVCILFGCHALLCHAVLYKYYNRDRRAPCTCVRFCVCAQVQCRHLLAHQLLIPLRRLDSIGLSHPFDVVEACLHTYSRLGNWTLPVLSKAPKVPLQVQLACMITNKCVACMSRPRMCLCRVSCIRSFVHSPM